MPKKSKGQIHARALKRALKAITTEKLPNGKLPKRKKDLWGRDKKGK